MPSIGPDLQHIAQMVSTFYLGSTQSKVSCTKIKLSSKNEVVHRSLFDSVCCIHLKLL